MTKVAEDIQKVLDTIGDAPETRNQLLSLVQEFEDKHRIRIKEKQDMGITMLRVKSELRKRALRECYAMLRATMALRDDDESFDERMGKLIDKLKSIRTRYPTPYPEAKSFIRKAMTAPKPESTRTTVKAFERAMGLRRD